MQTTGFSITHILRYLAMCMLLLGSMTLPVKIASAAVTDVTATSLTHNVAVRRTASASVSWQVFLFGLAGPTVSSSRGVFLTPAGAVIGSVNTLLTKAIAATTTQTLFSEQLLIPASIIAKANSLGANQIIYQRSFVDATSTVGGITGFLVFNITGSAGAGFSISREALSFEPDGLLYKVVRKGEKPRVTAELTYSGSGILRGVWEIAEPSTTAGGTPVFRPITHEQKFLGQLGQAIETSPELPGNMTGLYMVRFRVTSPAASFSPPVIRYFVGRGFQQPVKPVDIDLVAPKQQAPISSRSLFRWQKIAHAQAYVLEFFLPDAIDFKAPDVHIAHRLAGSPSRSEVISDKQPVSGMLVPTPNTKPSRMAYAHLKAGQKYFWRVRAIGANGRTIGISSLRAVTAN